MRSSIVGKLQDLFTERMERERDLLEGATLNIGADKAAFTASRNASAVGIN